MGGLKVEGDKNASYDKTEIFGSPYAIIHGMEVCKEIRYNIVLRSYPPSVTLRLNDTQAKTTKVDSQILLCVYDGGIFHMCLDHQICIHICIKINTKRNARHVLALRMTL